MKFSVNAASFIKGISPVVLVASTGVKKEYADGYKVMITADASGLTAVAHNGYIAIDNRPDGLTDYVCEDAGVATLNVENFSNSLASFKGESQLDFEIVGNELFIRQHDDTDEVQSLQTEASTITMPDMAKDFNKELSIKRDNALYAMNRVLFAVGCEKYNPEFFYWVLRIKKDNVRIAGGDGGRFAVYDIGGKNVVKTNDEFDICIYKEQGLVMPKLLSIFNDEFFTMKEFSKEEKDEDTLSDQIVLTMDNCVMMLVGHQSNIKWPNEEKFLSRKAKCRLTLSLADFELPIKGMNATNSKEIRTAVVVHKAQMDFDLSKSLLTLKVDGTMKSQRKLKIRDVKREDEFPEKFVFICTSLFLTEMYQQGDKDGRVQFEFFSEKAPVVIRFYAADAVSDVDLERVNSSNDTREKYSIFFAPSQKV